MRDFIKWAGNEMEKETGAGVLMMIFLFLLGSLGVPLYLYFATIKGLLADALIFSGISALIIWLAYTWRNQ